MIRRALLAAIVLTLPAQDSSLPQDGEPLPISAKELAERLKSSRFVVWTEIDGKSYLRHAGRKLHDHEHAAVEAAIRHIEAWESLGVTHKDGDPPTRGDAIHEQLDELLEEGAIRVEEAKWAMDNYNASAWKVGEDDEPWRQPVDDTRPSA